MVLAQPEQSIGKQNSAYFTTSIIKDAGSPLFMFSLTRVRIFIEMSTIKVAHGKAVFRKVRGYPVEQDANALLMHVVHNVLKILWGAKATSRGILPCDLVSPRLIVGILR